MLYSTFGQLLASCMLVSASENGGYYECDATDLEDNNVCTFALTSTAPEDWVTPAQPHDIDRTVGATFYRGVMGYAGDMLSVSPKPWVNGDELVNTAPDMITGDQWSGYALIFELMAPLRDMIMYDSEALTNSVDGEAKWKLWTRAMTDCNAKTTDYVARSGGTPWSTDQLYEYLKDPQTAGKNPHHYFLQYLEEGAMDLVCLSTDLEMEHCDVIRETAGAEKGVDRCNCWFDAYEAIYGECPVFDMPFTTCTNTVAPKKCADLEPVDSADYALDYEVDNSGETGAPGGVPTGPGVPPDKPAGPPA